MKVFCTKRDSSLQDLYAMNLGLPRSRTGYTDYGRPMKFFFIEILNVWNWKNKLVFSFKPFEVPCPCFLFNHNFYKKLSLLYPHFKYFFCDLILNLGRKELGI